jgi:hypothetical protein
MNYGALHNLSHWLQPGLIAIIPAVVLVFVARGLRQNTPRSSRVAGILSAVCFGVAGVGFSGVLLCGFTSSRYLGERHQCMSNLKQLGQAVLLYQQDWDDRLPAAEHWGDLAATSLTASEREQVFSCPVAPSSFDYGFNVALSRCPAEKISFHDETVLLFEMNAHSRNATGTQKDMARERHSGSPHVMYANGRAQHVNSFTQPPPRWSP